jgi:hypothetical protein
VGVVKWPLEQPETAHFTVGGRRGDGPLTEQIADARGCCRELVKMPQSSHWSTWSGRLKRMTTLARAHSAFRSGRCTIGRGQTGHESAHANAGSCTTLRSSCIGFSEHPYAPKTCSYHGGVQKYLR